MHNHPEASHPPNAVIVLKEMQKLSPVQMIVPFKPQFEVAEVRDPGVRSEVLKASRQKQHTCTPCMRAQEAAQ